MKTAVLVGATGNIGKALQNSLANEFALDQTWLGEKRPRISNPDAFHELPKTIHLAIYAAGVNKIQTLEETTDRDWDEVIDINFSGAFRFARAAAQRFPKDGSGILVFISSIMSTHPYPNRLAYSSSKGAVESLTKALAVEAAGEFSTFAIRLGHINALMSTTKTSPKLLDEVKRLSIDQKLSEPSEVANFITSLLPFAGLINGTTIEADRGYTINRWPL